jgi:hypothetical protein
MLGRLAVAAMLTLTVPPARAFWEGIERQAVMAVLDLGGDATVLFRGIRVHDFERGGGDDSRAVCGEAWIDGAPDYVRFVQPFGRFADRPEPIGLPLVAGLTEPPTGLDGLWASFCRDASRVADDEITTALHG